MENSSIIQKLPNHIGIIMDGNRRWASENGTSLLEAYKMSIKRAKEICLACMKLHINELTIFALSSDNLKKSSCQMNLLLQLFRNTFVEDSEFLNDNIRIKFYGSRKNLDDDIGEIMDKVEERTSLYNGLKLSIAFNYGGKDEIVDGFNSIIEKVNNNELQYDEMNEDTFEGFLWTKDMKDPDMIISTSGEQRTSGFLLWKASYSELFFLDKYWPDFIEEDLIECLSEYDKRDINRGR
ncbi:polyprenyl diphosphate synthase [Clostridium sp. UBA7503]|uniref:polyprenyl diphosphate synthase n=1 Tax=Clostridium sp. UBA7503 TaxID=1946377 RepID=UPI00321626FC